MKAMCGGVAAAVVRKPNGAMSNTNSTAHSAPLARLRYAVTFVWPRQIEFDMGTCRLPPETLTRSALDRLDLLSVTCRPTLSNDQTAPFLRFYLFVPAGEQGLS